MEITVTKAFSQFSGKNIVAVFTMLFINLTCL